eukprot:11200938-Lingulodinium_polyedra.AAC.1
MSTESTRSPRPHRVAGQCVVAATIAPQVRGRAIHRPAARTCYPLGAPFVSTPRNAAWGTP